MSVAKPSQLYLSNDPQVVAEHGVLFRADIPLDGASRRVRYHHVNGTQLPTRLLVVIANAGTAPATITLIGAGAGPSAAESLERTVDERFAAAVRAIAASRHVVAADHSYVLCDLVLRPDEGAAGCYDVAVSGGPGVEVRVIACDPSHHQLRAHEHLPDVKVRDPRRRGVFPL